MRFPFICSALTFFVLTVFTAMPASAQTAAVLPAPLFQAQSADQSAARATPAQYSRQGRTGNSRRERRNRPLPPPTPAEDFVNSAPVIGRNGLLYVGSWNHQLQALDEKTGAVRWKFTTGGIINASPAVGPNGTVYFTSHDKNVYALNGATGAKKWQYTTDGPLNTRPAVGSNGLVYVGASDKKVVALDAKTGAKKWEQATAIFPSSPALGSDNTVYVSADKLYAMNGKTGAVKWSLDIGVLPSQAPTVGANGTVYVGTTDAEILALDGATGDTLWTFSTDHPVDYPIVLGPGGILYASAQKLFAVRISNGKERWELSGGGSAWSMPVIGDNDVVYAGYNDSQVYALDAATGRTKWQFDTNDGLLCFPALGADGTVYFQCEGDGKVYALNQETGQARWIVDQPLLPSSVKPIVADVPAGKGQ